jgi:hypothetical protein
MVEGVSDDGVTIPMVQKYGTYGRVLLQYGGGGIWRALAAAVLLSNGT